MNNEFLSQDEVDSLLDGVNGEEESVEDVEGGVRPFHLGSQERIVRGRMPTMEVINERFARYFRIALFNLMSRTAEISVGPLRVQKFSEFIRNLPLPANLNIVQAKPLRGSALFVFDPTLISLVVDMMFGGDGRFHTRIEGRDFTLTEQRIIQNMLAASFESFGKAWQGIHALEFEYMSSEINPQFANIANPTEVVVATTFEIEIGSGGGAFHVCMPYAMLEPIRELLYSTMKGEHPVEDKRWSNLLCKQVKSADVELVAVLGGARISFEQVLSMKSGDVIALQASDTIVANIDNVPVMECHYGVSNGQYALKVDKMLSIPMIENEGGKHAG